MTAAGYLTLGATVLGGWTVLAIAVGAVIGQGIRRADTVQGYAALPVPVDSLTDDEIRLMCRVMDARTLWNAGGLS